MRSITFIVLLASFTIMLFAQNNAVAQGNSQKYSLAVLNLAEETGIFTPSDVRLLTGELTREIENVGLFFTMSQMNMEKGLLTKDLDPDIGCVDIGCATRSGQALGVQLVVLGVIGKSGSSYTIDAKMVHVASGEIIKTLVKNIDGDYNDIVEQMPAFARELMGISGVNSVSPSRNGSESGKESYKPANPPQEKPYSSSRQQSYQRGGGSKWLFIGLGALIAGGIGAGVMLLTGDNGDDGGGTVIPPPDNPGDLPGPPTFP